MKKNILLFLTLLTTQVIIAQFDKWPSVNTMSLSGGQIITKKSVKIDNDIFMVADTGANFGPQATGLFKYNTIDRSLMQVSYPLEWGDRGIQATTTYTTASASYCIFGCYSTSDNASFPVLYTYNSLTNSIRADSIYIGSPYDHNYGIQTMAMFSPFSNDDTLRIFSKYFNAVTVFKKQINQSTVSSDFVTLTLENAYTSIVFNNTLYVSGNFSVNNSLLESSDGRNFVNAAFFNSSNYINSAGIKAMQIVGSKLYFVAENFGSGFELHSTSDGLTDVLEQTFTERFKSMENHNGTLWISTYENSSNRFPSIYYLKNNNIILSNYISELDGSNNPNLDGSTFDLVSANDSLYFVGNYGTGFAAKTASNNSNLKGINNIRDNYINVLKLSPPVADFIYNNNLVCKGSTFTVTANCQNTDSTYWYIDGVYSMTSPGATAFTSVNFTTNGNHTIGLVAFGGTLKDSVSYNFTAYDITSSGGYTTAVTCNGFSNGTAWIDAQGGYAPYTFNWSNGATTDTIFGLSANTYSCTLTDVHGCEMFFALDVAEPTPLTASVTPMSATLTCASPSVQLDVISSGGTPGYTYNWSPVPDNSSSLIVTIAETYTIVVTDANGCTSSQTATIYSSGSFTAAIASSTNVSCNGLNDGALTAISTSSNALFNWTPGNFNTSTINNLSAGSYTCTITDAVTGCANTATATITEPAVFSAVIVSSSNVSCFGGNDGQAQVTAMGGSGSYSYAWDNISSSNLATNLSAGTHTVNIYDSFCGVFSFTVIINQPTQLTAISNQTNVTCFDGNNGSAEVIGAGGNGGYTYFWSHGFGSLTGGVISGNVTTNNYTCTVTDSKNCSIDKVVSITNGYKILIGTSISGGNVCEGAVKTLSVASEINAVAPTNYVWLDSFGAVVSNTGSYNYTNTVSGSHDFNLIVTDANGCSDTSAVVNIPVTSNKNIVGSVLTSTTNAIVAGNVTLYKYEPFFTKFDSITTLPIDGLGNYNFTNVPEAQYIVKAVPTSTNLQITYGTNASGWQSATIVTHGCTADLTHNVSVIALENIGVGTGVLTGTVYAGPGYVFRMSNHIKDVNKILGLPIKGVIVKGGRNPGTSAARQTSTDASGGYTLTGLPNNAPGEDYYVYVDIPGLDSNGIYHRVITSTNNQFSNLNFEVDSAKITPLSQVGIKEIDIEKYDLAVFPNPTNADLNIKFQLKENSLVSADLYDVIGNHIKTILPKTEMQVDRHHLKTDLNMIPNGIYFIKLHINERVINIRIVKAN